MITQEKVFYNESYEKKIEIEGKEVHLSHMTPRFFYEKIYMHVLIEKD